MGVSFAWHDVRKLPCRLVGELLWGGFGGVETPRKARNSMYLIYWVSNGCPKIPGFAQDISWMVEFTGKEKLRGWLDSWMTRWWF